MTAVEVTEGLCAFYPGGELNRDYGNWYALSQRYRIVVHSLP